MAGADVLRQPDEETEEELGARWFQAMRRGDFAAAWQASDAILRAHIEDELGGTLPGRA